MWQIIDIIKYFITHSSEKILYRKALLRFFEFIKKLDAHKGA